MTYWWVKLTEGDNLDITEDKLYFVTVVLLDRREERGGRTNSSEKEIFLSKSISWR